MLGGRYVECVLKGCEAILMIMKRNIKDEIKNRIYIHTCKISVKGALCINLGLTETHL